MIFFGGLPAVGTGVRGTFFHCCGNANLYNHFGNQVWWFLRKLGISLPQGPEIPFLSIYSKDAQSYHKDICSAMFIGALFIISRTWKQPRCTSTKEWIKKMWHIYTIEYYSAVKENGIMKFKGKRMELDKTILSEVSQTQKVKHSMYLYVSGY